MPSDHRPTLEICVDAPDDLLTAVEAGVDRIELCSALALGGLTPTPGLIELARTVSVPVYAMIRPRGGDFCYSAAELAVMHREIEAMRAAGLAGVVFGVATSDGALDWQAMAALCDTAQGLGRTLHRVVDDLADPVGAVRSAADLGFERILTSGGADKALQGATTISSMIQDARGEIEIMAGSGVNAASVPDLAAAGVWSFHASCAQKGGAQVGQQSIDPVALEALQSAIGRLT